MKFTMIYEWILKVFKYLSAAILVFAWLATCTEVFMRQALRSPTVWTVETTEYALLFITFLGAAWVLSMEGHITLDILPNMLKPRTRAFYMAVIQIIGCLVCLVLGIVTSESALVVAQRGARVESILGPPAVVILCVIPLGSLMLCIQFGRLAFANLNRWRAFGMSSRVDAGGS